MVLGDPVSALGKRAQQHLPLIECANEELTPEIVRAVATGVCRRLCGKNGPSDQSGWTASDTATRDVMPNKRRRARLSTRGVGPR